MRVRTDQLQRLNEARGERLVRRLKARFVALHPEAAAEAEAIVADTLELAEAVRFQGEGELLCLARWALVPNAVWQHEPWGPIIQRTLVNDEWTGARRVDRIRRELAPRLARDRPETRAALERYGVLPSVGGSGDEPAPAIAEEVPTQGAEPPATG